ncbi:unnamed protein product [Lactuca saligna]|uniref:Acetylornithine transaminase n=1 Tax=Lactuca saligna TaxID=75948 RepID=A0AA36E4Z3_LACSI|nr:unnamed protein product [Lactuca saligna]
MGEGQYTNYLQTMQSMRPVVMSSISNGFLPASTMHSDMRNINPKKGIMKLMDNKHQPLLITKAKHRDFVGGVLPSGNLFNYKGTEHAKNRDVLDFTSGALPPVDKYFISSDPFSTSKTLAEELAASASFAEASYLYPSATAALAAALTHAGEFQSFPHSTCGYISLSNNIPPTSSAPKDIGEVEKLVSEGKVAAVFVEPIHGNGGIKSFTPQYLQSLRTACDKSGVLLAFDEVQCGIGQTGRLWAHQALGVEPDFMIVRFRGMDIGALVVNKKMNAHIHKYENEHMHIPRECGEALNVFRKVAQRRYLDHVTEKGRYLEDLLSKQLGRNARVKGIQAFGLVAAVELDVDAQSFVDECKKRGLGVEVVGKGNIIRIMPPFMVTTYQLDDAVGIIDECLGVLGGNDWVGRLAS